MAYKMNNRQLIKKKKKLYLFKFSFIKLSKYSI